MKIFASSIWSGIRKRHRWRYGSDGFSIYHLFTNRRPRSVPEAFWRSMKTLKALLWITFLIAVFFLIFSVRGLLATGPVATHVVDRHALSLFACIIVLHGCAAMFGSRIARGRYRRFLIDHSWLICLRCGYVLTGLPSHHRCPECDLRFNSTELKKTWRSWIDRNLTYLAKQEEVSDQENLSG